MEHCVNCGHPLSVGRYCTNCGHPVGAAASDWRTDTNERAASPAAPPTPAPTLAPTPAAQTPPTGPPQAPPPAWTPPPARFPLYADEASDATATYALPPAPLSPAPPPPGPLPDGPPPEGPGPLPPAQYRRRQPWGVWAGVAVALVLVIVLGIALLTNGNGGSGSPAAESPGGGSPSTAPSDKPSPSQSKSPVVRSGELASQASVQVPATAAPGRDLSGRPVSYGGKNMLDGDPETTWRMPGDGSGAEIQLTLPRKAHLTTVGLINGYAKQVPGRDWYHGNRRIQKVEWLFDDGSTVGQDLTDTTDLQTVDVDTETTTITLRLVSVSKPGAGPARRDFTAISDVSLVAG